MPDAFCRKDFQPHKQALTRAGAETWPRQQGRGCRERLPRAGGLRGRGGHRPAPWARTQRLPLSPLGRPCGRSPGREISRHSACRVFVAGTLGG